MKMDGPFAIYLYARGGALRTECGQWAVGGCAGMAGIDVTSAGLPII